MPNEPGRHNPGCQTRILSALWMACRLLAAAVMAVLAVGAFAVLCVLAMGISSPAP